MGFLSIKGNSIYLSIDANAKPVRPLAREAISKWVRSIPGCTKVGADNKEQQLRKFTMIDADFSQWLKNNPDPLWDQLEHQDKFKQSGERQDFSLRPQHILPVWSYADNDVKVIKQGNQLFEEMDRFDDTGGDVTTCDWMVWFEGNGRRKSYKTSRQNPTGFAVEVDQATLVAKMEAVMEQALADLTPFKTEDAMLTYIHGDQDQQQQQQVAAPAPQQAMPGYVPGGQPGVALGATPALPAPQAAPVGVVPQPTTTAVPIAAPQGVPLGVIPQPTTTAVPQTGVLPGQMPMPGVMGVAPVPGVVGAAPMPGVGIVATGVPQTVGPQAVPQGVPAGVPQAMPQQVESPVPNAPVASQPVFAPPVAAPMPAGVPQAMPQDVPAQVPTSAPQAAAPVPAAAPPVAAPAPVAAPNGGADPFSVVIDSGKYKGQTLGQVAQTDAKYLSYLKGTKKDLAPAIEMVLSNAQAPAAPAAAPAAAVDASSEEARGELVKAVNEKIMQVQEFQGTGVTTHMMPFIEQHIGTTNFSEAPLDKLQILNQAIDQKLTAGA